MNFPLLFFFASNGNRMQIQPRRRRAERRFGVDVGRRGPNGVGSVVAHCGAPFEGRPTGADRLETVHLVHAAGARRKLARTFAAQSHLALVHDAVLW